MSDRLSTQLIIGGKIPSPEARDALAKAIGLETNCRTGDELEEGLSVIGDALAGKRAAYDPWDCRVVGHEGRIYLSDVEKSWGDFEEVRVVCHELGIPYQQHTEAKYDYPEQTLIFRPDRPDFKGNAEQVFYTMEGAIGRRLIDADVVLDRLIAGLNAGRKAIPYVKADQAKFAWEKHVDSIVRDLRALQTPGWALGMVPVVEYDGE